MKIKWLQYCKKECWEIRTPKKIPEARFISFNDDIPDLTEYNKESVSGTLFYTIEKVGKITKCEQMIYWLFGYRHLQDIIRKKYNLEYNHIEILK